MTISIKEKINSYRATLSAEMCSRFDQMNESAQIAEVISNTTKAEKTETYGLNLEVDQTKQITQDQNVWNQDYKEQNKQPPKTGLVVEKNDSTKLALEKKPQTNKPKTNYVVQLGESIDDLVKKSLVAQDKEINEANFKECKEKFIKANSVIIRTNTEKNEQYLIAGKIAVLEGKIDTSKNKSQAEVNASWKKTNHKQEIKPEIKQETLTQTKIIKLTKAATDDELKSANIIKKPHCQYIKNIKTGNISAIYNAPKWTIGITKDIETYSDKGQILQKDFYDQNGEISTYRYSQGKLISETLRKPDKTKELYYGGEGNPWASKVTYDQKGKATYYRYEPYPPDDTDNWIKTDNPKLLNKVESEDVKLRTDSILSAISWGTNEDKFIQNIGKNYIVGKHRKRISMDLLPIEEYKEINNIILNKTGKSLSNLIAKHFELNPDSLSRQMFASDWENHQNDTMQRFYNYLKKHNL